MYYNITHHEDRGLRKEGAHGHSFVCSSKMAALGSARFGTRLFWGFPPWVLSVCLSVCLSVLLVPHLEQVMRDTLDPPSPPLI